jgi:hypothetical protein
MKAGLIAVLAAAAGVAVGWTLTQREFAREALPVDLEAVSASAGPRTSAPLGPKITVINGERHDFGTMDRGSHGRHAFLIRNDGDAPLTLATGRPSCGVCVKVFQATKERLEPGEKAEVIIEWDVVTNETEFEQSGPVNTNDPSRPTVTLYISGRVIDTVRAERGDLHFHDLSTNEASTASLNLYAFRDPDLQVHKYELNNPVLSKFVEASFAPLEPAELAREPGAKGGLKMTVRIKPGLPLGDFNEPLLIHTNQSSETPVTVRLIGNVASDVLVMGPGVVRERLLVNLGTFSHKEGKKQTIYVLVKGPYRDATTVQLAGVEPQTDDFRVTLGEPLHDTAKTIRYPLTIEIPPGALPVSRLDAAKIHLTTTHPDVKELTLRVRYVAKE